VASTGHCEKEGEMAGENWGSPSFFRLKGVPIYREKKGLG